ncbi:MAG: long-chain-fatty-acyl-CoA reductase [Verrucomicrobiaceae bacterium]|nr:long-chain-fatty-acyl-CoA reductase [Verrucomicrobiaceae bacterium]
MTSQAKADQLITRLEVPHFVKGVVKLGAEVEQRSRAQSTPVFTPKTTLDEMVWRRHEPTPAFNTPIADIIDFLVEVGERLDFDNNPYLQEAVANMSHFSSLDPRVLENAYRDMPFMFRREGIVAEIEQTLGSLDVLDGWVARNPYLPSSRVRAIPPRMVHVLAGNAPVVPPITIVRGAVTKGVHLLKLPSNDMFTTTAILRTMADVDPNHPTTRSFSAVYWRGGDEKIESAIYRSQYFDKIVVWGGEAAVKHVVKYTGPGLEMVSFDPKVSVSMIGRAVFESPEVLREVAAKAAADVIGWNQDACSASRFQYVEGSTEEVDQYCEELVKAMAVDTRYGPGKSNLIPPADLREQLDMLQNLEPIYRVFGRYDGNGMVVRSDEPVSFSPTGKLVNVVRVDKLADAVQFITVATQTVGIYPKAERLALRDSLASCGAQRLVEIGDVNGGEGFGGSPHDAGMPVNRFMRWVVESGDHS